MPEVGLELYKFRTGLRVVRIRGWIACDILVLSSLPRKLRFLVPEVGLEPTLLTEHDFESCASTIPPLRQCADSTLSRAKNQKPHRSVVFDFLLQKF